MCHQTKKTNEDTPKGVTNASAPQAPKHIIVFSSEAGGTGLEESIDASTPTAVLPLNGGSGAAIRSLELNQWGGVHGQTASPLAKFRSLSANPLARICCSGGWVLVSDVRCLSCGSQGDNGRVGPNGLGRRRRGREVLNGGEARKKERRVRHAQE